VLQKTKEQLMKKNLIDKFLKDKNPIMNEDVIIDGGFKEDPCHKNSYAENKQINEGGANEQWQGGTKTPMPAGRRKNYYDFKNHSKIDAQNNSLNRHCHRRFGSRFKSNP
jgi:hypothetical protein